MGRIKKAFDKLKQQRSVSVMQPESSHLKNISGGNTITLNGKEYVKVKLRFVDTLDANGSQYLMNLEAELELLRKEVEVLSGIRDANAEKIKSLETFTINLYKVVTTEKAKLHTGETKLLSKIEQYKSRIAKKNNTILALGRKLKQQKEQITRQNNEIEKLQKEIQQQNVDVLELMAQLERLHVGNEASPLSVD
jgi:hypothetical protein